jgi:hypothetical protein
MGTYKKSQAGIYDVEYDFKDETDGSSTITDWTDIDEGTGDSYMKNEYQGHVKVVDLEVPYVLNDIAGREHAFGESKDEGIVEGWLHTNRIDSGYNLYVDLLQTDDTLVARLYLDGSPPVAYSHDDDNLVTLSTDSWIRFAICWNNTGGAKDVGDGGGNLDDGDVRYYLNGVDEGDFPMENEADVDKVAIYAKQIAID